jgi:hypothetical protein
VNIYIACGLTRLAAAAKLPLGVKRKNDGRFFFGDEMQAETMAAMLDSRR